ncbi:MAG: ribonuclease Y [Candidatus Vogelbacteria bacterium]|nr:ribonuclease Y [Candidatus Vogelbacteria bacterium]
MTLATILIIAASIGLGGIVFGYFLRLLVTLGKKGSIEMTVKQTLLDAKSEAQAILDTAKKKVDAEAESAKRESSEKQSELKRLEERLIKKDELLDGRQSDIDRELEQIKQKVAEVKEIRERTDRLETEKLAELERISNLSPEEARQELISHIEREHEEDLTLRLKKLEREAVQKLDRRAKDILSTAIQRLATSTASDIMTTTVLLPSDDLKGKIIGKEGRNIRAFERASGVEVIIDDTPGSIVLSAFDPVRRHIAKVALENLLADGRIQPARIEEMVEKARTEINKIMKERGEQAAYEAGVFNLDPRLIGILGRLHFRTSYGQNVLQHSIEMAHIAGMLAEELGGDVSVAKTGALLHDIGKAMDHEVAGTHVDIGRRILQKFGVEERIVQAMQSHHEEYPYETLESVIVQTADAISGGRPGARRDSVENYLKRLTELEEIAHSFPGVEKAYAIAAGREVRIFVNPTQINDIEAQHIARDTALRIEKELKYPGEIKILVIRENRIIEYAR